MYVVMMTRVVDGGVRETLVLSCVAAAAAANSISSVSALHMGWDGMDEQIVLYM